MLAGGCQCGAVRYTIAVDRPDVYACHCRECQKQSASAFGMSLPVRAEDFAVTGAMATWERDTYRGTRSRASFCPSCGSRVYHQIVGSTGFVTVKGGSLDDTSWLAPVAHIWVSRRQPWVVLDPATPTHPTQPDDMLAWRRSFAADA